MGFLVCGLRRLPLVLNKCGARGALLFEASDASGLGIKRRSAREALALRLDQIPDNTS